MQAVRGYSRRLDFGKHKGKLVEQVDSGYLRWILENLPKCSPWWKVADNALREREHMKQQLPVEKYELLTHLKFCSVDRDLNWGRTIHARVMQGPNGWDSYVLSAVINMYRKCGSMVDAQAVFDTVQEPNVVHWNTLLLGYAENGEPRATLDVFNIMKDRGCPPNSGTYIATLKAYRYLAANGDASVKEACLERGREIHLKAGNDLDNNLLAILLDMYCRCGSMGNARSVFDSMVDPNVVSWNTLLLGYVENGLPYVTLDMFHKMKERGCIPNSVTYMAFLKACKHIALKGDSSDKIGCLERCRNVHTDISRLADPKLQTTLVDSYAKCGSIVDARRAFETILKPDVIAWTAMLLGYADNGEGYTALDMFMKMKAAGCSPNSVAYTAALKACISLAWNGRKVDGLEQGRKLHTEIRFQLDQNLQTVLVEMYCKCGSMIEAHWVFESITNAEVTHWNALISGYAENREELVALDMFSKMKAAGCLPTSPTYVAALKACTSLAATDVSRKIDALEYGRKVHFEIEFHPDHYLQTTLVDMYSKCGSMLDARGVFDSIEKPDVVAWNALLLGYVDNGEGNLALDMFARMKEGSTNPNYVTYMAAVKACTTLAVNGGRSSCLKRGRDIHSEVGHHLNHCLQNSLIHMYAKCDSMLEARGVFDAIRSPDVVSWNALLLGYLENDEAHVAVSLYTRMKAAGYAPDSVTYVAVLRAYTSLAANGEDNVKLDCLERGRSIHSEIGCHLDPYVQNTLVDMYSKCGSVNEARLVFDNIQNPNVVSWTSLISGYADNGEAHLALDIFAKMKAKGCAPDSVTYIAVLKACGLIGALVLGRKFHSEITDFTPNVVTCLVDFYAKCGSMLEAREVFELHSKTRTVSTWTALIAGHGRFGDSVSVFKLFEAMKDEGLRPDTVTFVFLLLCCSHAGLVAKATECFEAMSRDYHLTPTVIHYNCMVDALGRGNQLDKAITMMRSMSCTPNAVTWSILLAACRKWKNVEIGKEAFQALADLDKRTSFPYVLMADIYPTSDHHLL